MMKKTTVTASMNQQEGRADEVAVFGDAVEAAGIGLILDDELLQDQRFGERDHRAIDPVDVALEGDDAEEEGEQHRHRQRAEDREGGADQRHHEVGQSQSAHSTP